MGLEAVGKAATRATVGSIPTDSTNRSRIYSTGSRGLKDAAPALIGEQEV